MLPSTFILYEVVVLLWGAAAAAAFIHGTRCAQPPDPLLTDEYSETVVTGVLSAQLFGSRGE
jgi:hypothetical protein